MALVPVAARFGMATATRVAHTAAPNPTAATIGQPTATPTATPAPPSTMPSGEVMARATRGVKKRSRKLGPAMGEP
jgi:hypothetical protein